MLNVFSLRTNYGSKNGKQFLGKTLARVIGENNYEYFRMEARIFNANYYYRKQYILNRMALEVPDVVNAFGILQKEDTSHGFPVWRPLERNSDFALYNINSEGWFQIWSVLSGAMVVSFWFYVACYNAGITSTNVDDEDFLRLKDAKSGQIWERNFWAFTFYIHGYHMSAMQREVKFLVLHPDDPKLNVRSSFNVRNPYAPDRYYKGWGEMKDLRMM